MKPIFIILILIISIWSLVTTFRAIYLISTKPFKGSKLTWILIALIGFVGPILWITKGKKLVCDFD